MISVNFQGRQYHMISNDGETAKIIVVNYTDGLVSSKNKPINVNIIDIDFVFLNKEFCLSKTKI